MKQFTRHPISAEFRDFTPEEYQAMKDSLLQDGQRDDIVSYEDTILDGWHRYTACLDIGIEPRIKGYTGADAEGYARRVNIARRHESKSDRDERILRMRSQGKSTRQIAEEVGVNNATVSRVINESTVANATVDMPTEITGKDGKKRKARVTTKPKPEQAINKPQPGEIPKEDNDMANRPQESIAMDEQIKKMRESGLSHASIAAKFGVHPSAVKHRIDKMRLTELEEKAKTADELAAIARGQLSLTAQQKLDRAITMAVEAAIIKMRKEATQQVDDAINAERESLQKMKAETYQALEDAKRARDSAIEARKSVDQHMTYEEFKLIRGCLHPDKQPEDHREKYNRALQIFMRLEKSVNPHMPIAELRKRGWEHVSPFAKARSTH